MATLAAWDEAVFHWINAGLAQSWLDSPMMFISSKYTWAVLGVLTLAVAAWRRRGQLIQLCLLLGLTIAVSDFVTYQVVKPLVARERPCKQLHELRLVPIWCGGDYGMPSNHATNGMALTVILALNAPPLAAVLALGLTLLTGLSRVYLGVHFPGDVLAGFCFGGLIGLLCHLAFARAMPPIFGLWRRWRGTPPHQP